MSEVSDVNPAHKLVSELRSQLERNGSVHQEIRELRELGIDSDQWRGAARRAARQLGRPVQTGAGIASVWAVLRDWPATVAERAHHQAQLRRAVEAASTTVLRDDRQVLHRVD